MKLPPVQPRSRMAHEAAHWARAAGYFNEYSLSIFRAFFERGEDIGKKDVLVRLASELGLDGQALGVALEQGDLRKVFWRRSKMHNAMVSGLFRRLFPVVR